MTKGLFFDLDGTLVDTLSSNVASYDQAIRCVLGEKIDVCDGLEREIGLGKSSNAFLKELIPGITDEQMRAVRSKKADFYPHHLADSVLNGDLVDFIKRKRADGDSLIVLVTTAKERNAMNVLKHHGIQDLFDRMVFGDGIKHLKPNPEIYLAALALVGANAEDSEAFEDTDAGIKAAEGAGIRAHRIVWDSK